MRNALFMLCEPQEDILEGHRYQLEFQEPPTLLDHESSEILADIPAELAFDDERMRSSAGKHLENPGQSA